MRGSAPSAILESTEPRRGTARQGREEMVLSAVARLLLVLGRLVGLAGAALTMGTIAAGVFLFFYYGPTWNVGILPLVVTSQTVVAAWVVRGVLKLGSRPLLRVLLLAGGVSFLGLFGWYFLLAGDGAELGAVGNLLYLLAGLLVALAFSLCSDTDTLESTSPRHERIS